MTSFSNNEEKISIVCSYVQDNSADRSVYMTLDAIDLYNKLSSKNIDDGYLIDRDDPYFVQTITQLGTERSSGVGSNLKIITVEPNTIGVVFQPSMVEIRRHVSPDSGRNLFLTNDAKKLFKELSGIEFTDDIPRHNEYLVKVVQKLGDRVACYPTEMVEIDYIHESLISRYVIDRTGNCEKVIITGSPMDEKIKLD